MTRVLITGSRSWKCLSLATRIIDRLIAKYGAEKLTIVHGACPTGVDLAFDSAANAEGITVERFPADWDKHGYAAGPIRNKTMVDSNPSFVIACHKSLKWSKGTKGCVRLALNAGIPVYLIDAEDGEPKRLEELL